MRGLEPPRLTAQPPQDCVYTNFTTSASVPRRGLEPPRPCGHSDLNAACIPISPPGLLSKNHTQHNAST